MNGIALPIVGIAALLLMGGLGELLWRRVGVPSTVLLFFCGLMVGPVFGWIDGAETMKAFPALAAVILVTSLVQYASQVRWQLLKRAGTWALVASVLAALMSWVVVMLVLSLAQGAKLSPDDWGWAHTWLAGAVLIAPCALVGLPLCKGAACGHDAVGELGLQASVGAVLAVGATAVLAGVFASTTGATGLGAVRGLISLLVAGFIGAIAGTLWVGFLHMINAPSMTYTMTIAAGLLVYLAGHAAGIAGATGAFAVVAFGLVLGNASAAVQGLGRRLRVSTNQEASADRERVLRVVQAMAFLFMGLMFGHAWDLVALGVVLGLMLVASRVPSAVLSVKKQRLDRVEAIKLVASGPRGWVALGLCVAALPALSRAAVNIGTGNTSADGAVAVIASDVGQTPMQAGLVEAGEQVLGSIPGQISPGAGIVGVVVSVIVTMAIVQPLGLWIAAQMKQDHQSYGTGRTSPWEQTEILPVKRKQRRRLKTAIAAPPPPISQRPSASTSQRPHSPISQRPAMPPNAVPTNVAMPPPPSTTATLLGPLGRRGEPPPAPPIKPARS